MRHHDDDRRSPRAPRARTGPTSRRYASTRGGQPLDAGREQRQRPRRIRHQRHEHGQPDEVRGPHAAPTPPLRSNRLARRRRRPPGGRPTTIPATGPTRPPATMPIDGSLASPTATAGRRSDDRRDALGPLVDQGDGRARPSRPGRRRRGRVSPGSGMAARAEHPDARSRPIQGRQTNAAAIQKPFAIGAPSRRKWARRKREGLVGQHVGHRRALETRPVAASHGASAAE